jgi:hypothetical protein
MLGMLVLGFYLFLPDHFGAGNGVLPNGGYMKSRMAVLLPLIGLACLREPVQVPPSRYLLRGLMVALLAVNLVLVTETVRQGSRILQQYTAGIDAVGRDHRLIANQGGREGRLVNIISAAASYYCLGTDNVYLDNYEASTPHFPIKYRAGIARQRAEHAADVVICWRAFPGPVPGDWQEIFAQGPLRILRAGRRPPAP